MFEKSENITLYIEGMSCMHCVKSVTDALKAMKGVKKAEVSLENKCAEITFLPLKTSREDMVKTVCDLGFEAK